MFEIVYINDRPKLKSKKPTEVRDIPSYAMEDCKKIRRAIRKHIQEQDITLGHCYDLYHAYSEYTYCSGWTGGIDVLSEESIALIFEDFLGKLEWVD